MSEREFKNYQRIHNYSSPADVEKGKIKRETKIHSKHRKKSKESTKEMLRNIKKPCDFDESLAEEIELENEVRRQGAGVLSRFDAGIDAVKPQLSSALKDPDAIVRGRVLVSLRKLEAEALAGRLPELAAILLEDEDPDVREIAAKTILETGPAAAGILPALNTALSDQNSSVVITVAVILLELSPEQSIPAIPRLVELLEIEEPQTARQVALILNEIGKPSVEHLITLLDSDKVEGRSRSANVLGWIGSPAEPAVPKLKAMFRDENEEDIDEFDGEVVMSISEKRNYAGIDGYLVTLKQDGVDTFEFCSNPNYLWPSMINLEGWEFLYEEVSYRVELIDFEEGAEVPDADLTSGESPARVLEALVEYFKASGLEVGERSMKAYSMMGAVAGFGLEVEGAEVELYIFDSETAEAELVDNLKEARETNVFLFAAMNMEMPVVMNGDIMLTGLEVGEIYQHPAKDLVVEVFSNFKI